MQIGLGIMKISLVISVYNEVDSIRPLINKIEEALKDLNYEIVFVDDGSTDGTLEAIKSIENEKIKTVVFNKNYGQTTAMAAGIDYASGDYIATLDGDMQNDPADIPKMIKLLEDEGWDVVAGRRAKRKDSLFIRKIPSKIANTLIRRLTKVYINDYGCTLKVFKSEIAKNLGLYGELHRFIPVLAVLLGARITEVDVNHYPRIYGETKYGLSRTFRVMSDLLLMVFFQKYLQRPMHIFGTIGILAFIIGAFINFYLLVIKLFGEDIGGRPLLVLGIMLTLGGVQLISCGIIAEIIMRTYYETQKKSTYLVKEVLVGKKSS
jgi:glycosyltransferase involved in cell wall biosynthesis